MKVWILCVRFENRFRTRKKSFGFFFVIEEYIIIYRRLLKKKSVESTEIKAWYSYTQHLSCSLINWFGPRKRREKKRQLRFEFIAQVGEIFIDIDTHTTNETVTAIFESDWDRCSFVFLASMQTMFYFEMLERSKTQIYGNSIQSLAVCANNDKQRRRHNNIYKSYRSMAENRLRVQSKWREKSNRCNLDE